ncbi:MAG TPA: DUF58 domain-containing protein [Micromonosporaceae bacterium]|nr:DUF58 domain-containing protein [Micromonosporaceae bacterium]
MVTPRAAAFIGASTLLGAFPVAFGLDPWVVVSAATTLITLILFTDRALAADPRAIRLERIGDTNVRLGETATVQLLLHNADDSGAELLVRDAWVPSAGATPETQELSIPPGHQATMVTTLTPTRRGDRPSALVTIRSFGPLRLTYRQADHRPEWTLRVLPRFASRKHLPEKLAKLRVVEGAIAVRGRGQGTEFDTLREYVPGDDVRSIDWRATARRNDVMLRTWRPERSRRVVCVLDTGRTSAVRIADEPRLDAAMEAALLLAAVAQEAGDQVDLLAADSQVRAAVSGVQGRSLLPRLVNALAPLHPALIETDFELITSEILRRERKRSLVVLFTALEPGALGEGLLPVLPKLVARHQVLVAAVHDPALTELASTPVYNANAVYSVAAGTRALMERQRIASALTGNGVSVLDCPADSFPSEVTDAYLALKAAGRL